MQLPAISHLPAGYQRLFLVLAATALSAVVGWIDGVVVASLWVCYLLPIGSVSWFAGWRAGVMMAVLCAVLSVIAQIGAPTDERNHWVLAWYVASICIVFALAAFFPARVSLLLTVQTHLAREDSLTRIPNRLSFTERLPVEVQTAAGRHTPITVGLVQIHGLAYVNERFGTTAGDHLLLSTAATLRDTLDKQDVIGRVGGTTFAVVLRGKGEEAARAALEHVRAEVLRKINLYDRPISVAIAAVSTDRPTQEGQHLLDRTGWLLHSIKQDRTSPLRESCSACFATDTHPGIGGSRPLR
jgi:diguanylate cyclase (GGDEF)-like protein